VAKLLPPKFPGGTKGEPWSERTTYNALQQLDDRWTVLYSVSWQSKRHGREGDGEADFVLIHPDYGILVSEVKGGSRIDLIDGQWFSKRRGQMVSIKNPFSQATDSKHYLARWLSERVSGFQGASHIGHFVIFPSHTQEGSLGPDGPREIICDRIDLETPGASLKRIGEHWGNRRLKPDQITQIVKELRPTVSIRRFLRDRVDEVSGELDSLTDEQVRAIGLLRRQRRVTIRGAAGTGKTVLATARARELDARGFRTLLLCYNKPLSERLKDDLADTSVTVNTFHGLCYEYADDAGLLGVMEVSDNFWDEVLPEELPSAAEMLEKSFDAIVIDEGQDFLPAWWTALELLLEDVDDGIFYVFADTNQDVFQTGWEPPDGKAPAILTINCRNTLQIASRVHALCDGELDSIGVQGIQPAFIEVSTPRQLEKALGSTLEKLIREEGLRPEQVMILYAESDLQNILEGQKFGSLRVGDRKGSIHHESVRRFKGLEADAVILLLPGETSENTRKLSYVGMSRAKTILIVIGSTEAKEALAWDSQ
jgi:hypothetical protein